MNEQSTKDKVLISQAIEITNLKLEIEKLKEKIELIELNNSKEGDDTRDVE